MQGTWRNGYRYLDWELLSEIILRLNLDYSFVQFDGEVPVMLGLWRMQSTLSLPSLPSPLWPRSGGT